ncbi:MAG: endopeptidase La [Magnetospirillum sp.]|nr:endopeptidase La [Magnetospirillum sp.]
MADNDAPSPSATHTAPPAADDIPIVPVRGTVLFPGVAVPLTIGRARSLAAVQEALRRGSSVGIVLQRDEQVDDPTLLDLHRIGTLGEVVRFITAGDGTHQLVCHGEQRFRIDRALRDHPYLEARVQRIPEPGTTNPEIEGRARHLRQLAVEALELIPQAPSHLMDLARGIEPASLLADLVASYIDIPAVEKQELLETIDIERRLDKVLAALGHQLEVLRVTRRVSERTREAIDERQRRHILEEHLRAIQQELGQGEEGGEDIRALDEAIATSGMPPEPEQQARRELGRLRRMPEASAEYGMVRNYVEWLTELPWAKESDPAIDLQKARAVLEADHFGLDKIKRRILEFLAVRKLAPEGKSPILCFVGPPGVGKTSLGQSIARATGRNFVRISLGGVHDEAEIRGHRRTYIGALPGNIIQALRKAGTRNPVFMLDEVDKMGAGIHGDPAAAMLEVLDPEQNSSFRDNYLGVPFDLSRVIFITTANVLENIPGPLRDRMEVIELAGYTEDEKVAIAERYLVARQRIANGVPEDTVRLDQPILRALIRDYTREAGVRNLERTIGAVMRHAAVRIADGEAMPIAIGPGDLHDILGPARFENETAMRTAVPGVATGLAWTPAGGDILFIEAARVPGGGKLILTGQLGEVMKESAQAALSLVKARAVALGVDPALFESSDIHIHVPAGAIPKDGPSAGTAIFTALVSLLTNRTVRNDTAMTGEISLRGLVLPVGGIKEKVTAAARAGLVRVLLPARNAKDLDDVPAAARAAVAIDFMETVDDAIAKALSP